MAISDAVVVSALALRCPVARQRLEALEISANRLYVVANGYFYKAKTLLFQKQRNHFEIGSNNAPRISNDYAILAARS